MCYSKNKQDTKGHGNPINVFQAANGDPFKKKNSLTLFEKSILTGISYTYSSNNRFVYTDHNVRHFLLLTILNCNKICF